MRNERDPSHFLCSRNTLLRQSCCNWLLGRLKHGDHLIRQPWHSDEDLELRKGNRKARPRTISRFRISHFAKRTKMGLFFIISVSSTLDLPHHYTYFNQRIACPVGAWPLNPEGNCEQDFCCKRTSFEIARWDHRVRGKCWVLRIPRISSESSFVNEGRFYFLFLPFFALAFSSFASGWAK